MNAYARLRIYFYSGTGNSYRAALWMAEVARRRGLAVDVTPIDQGPAAPPQPGDLIGLACPTHGFTAPWSMLRFALTMPPAARTGAKAFTLLTRAGMRIGRVYIPGLDGAGAYLLLLLLMLRGYHPAGATGLDMPAMWTLVIPSLSPSAVEGILARARPRAERFIGRILDGGAAFWSLIPLLLGLLLLPVSFLYLVMGRFFIAKMYYASTRCDGCGLCARACPTGGVKMRGKLNPRPFWTFSCEQCSRCINFCPRQAVEGSYPFGAIIYYLGSIPVAAWLLDALARRMAFAAGWHTPLAEYILQYPFRLVSLAAAYLVFTRLMRVGWANRLFTRLTPTHYYRRYHEPGVRLSDLRRKTP